MDLPDVPPPKVTFQLEDGLTLGIDAAEVGYAEYRLLCMLAGVQQLKQGARRLIVSQTRGTLHQNDLVRGYCYIHHELSVFGPCLGRYASMFVVAARLSAGVTCS